MDKQDNTPHRGLDKETLDFYGCFVVENSIYLPYGEGVFVTRSLSEKEYRFVGDVKKCKLFGMDRFGSGQGEAITVFESAYDAMSGFQMTGSKYPNVACRSASSAEKECGANYEYLNSFKKIVLCFDTDKPGREAAQRVASLFTPGRVMICDLGTNVKDANELLNTPNSSKTYNSFWWSAKKFKHDKIVGDYDEIAGLLDGEEGSIIGSYPFPTLQEMTFGIRESEIVLLLAQEKIGKTEIMGALEYHLLKTTDHNVGIIHIEEKPKRIVQRLVTYESKIPVHLPTSEIGKEQQLEIFKSLTKRDNRVHIYSHFGSDEPDALLEIIRYLVVACGCKFIFFDHITMVVTGQKEERDERKTLDYISTRLAMLVRELNFTLFLVSHVNDEGKTRGSRNIAKIANLILSLERDKKNPDPTIRNTTKVMVEGNREVASSGPAGELFFDVSTYTISEKKDVEKHNSLERLYTPTPRTMEGHSSVPSIEEVKGLLTQPFEEHHWKGAHSGSSSYSKETKDLPTLSIDKSFGG